jgi:hypothetical protein
MSLRPLAAGLLLALALAGCKPGSTEETSLRDPAGKTANPSDRRVPVQVPATTGGGSM